MTAQTKLTDTQTTILIAAAGRPDGNPEPLPATLRGGARAKVIEGLLARGLVPESEGSHLPTTCRTVAAVLRGEPVAR